MRTSTLLLLCFFFAFQLVALKASLEPLSEVSFENEMQEVAIASEKNDLADTILAKSNLPPNFALEFLSMLDEPKQGTIWHNYILQKLDTLYLHSDAAEERETILKRLWKESRSPTPTFAGTTLMTLQRLHEKRPEVVDSSKLAKHAKWVSELEAYSHSDRLSALHILSVFSMDAAGGIARSWLQNENAALLLKTTAIAVLAKDPSPLDNTLLETYLNHPDLRLRTASRSALRDMLDE